MASKVYDPTKIAVYPDHSTLCEAFRAHRPQAAAHERAYAPLRAWFEQVAREANLCLSPVHLVELAGWDERATADEMARWYAGLPIVWVRMFQGAVRLEAEHWTKAAAGVPVPSEMKPFAPSLLTAFEAMDQNAAAALLAAGAPELALVQTARTPQWRALWRTRYVDPFITHLVAIAVNHHHFRAQPGWTEQMGRNDVAYNVRVHIRERARDADARLTNARDAAYAGKQCSAGEVQDLLVGMYAHEATAMPLLRLEHAFNAGAVARMDRGQITNGSPSARLRRDLESSFGDRMHLAGGAYCDAFTCDGAVSGWIGGLRESFGLPRQLAARGYPGGAEAFVRDLMTTSRVGPEAGLRASPGPARRAP